MNEYFGKIINFIIVQKDNRQRTKIFHKIMRAKDAHHAIITISNLKLYLDARRTYKEHNFASIDIK